MNEEAVKIVNEAEKEVKEELLKIDALCERNSLKVLNA